MRNRSFLWQRLIWMIPVLFGISCLSFMMMKMAPGDPTSFYRDPTVSQADLQQIRHNLGLDQPVVVQYGKWLVAVLSGDLGYSTMTGQPVGEVLLSRLGPTLILTVPSFLLIVCLSVPLGLIAGRNVGGAKDTLITLFTFLGMAMPSFWLGLMLMLFFSLKLGWLPSSGYLDPLLRHGSFWAKSVNIAQHLVLPMMTMVLGGLATLTRYLRTEVIGIVGSVYIQSAKARGLRSTTILYGHVLRNALLPLVTLFGLQLPGLIGGSFVIEFIFGWPGMGKLGIDAAFARDYPVLMGLILLSSLMIILGNLFSDWAYQKVDPRVVIDA